MSSAGNRQMRAVRHVTAGCSVCHGGKIQWQGGQAQGTAARHHDATGHATWSVVVLSVHYGVQAADPRQIDIEDSIASLGSRPDAAPLTDSDAPTVPAVDVSATKAAQSKRALAAAKPEPNHV